MIQWVNRLFMLMKDKFLEASASFYNIESKMLRNHPVKDPWW